MRRDRVTAGLAPTLALGMLSLATQPAASQTLDLGAAPTAPALDKFTYANHLVGELEHEIADRLAADRSATAVEKLALQAMVSIRVMAADMLTAADRAGEDGSLAFLAGLTLADGRHDIDRALQSFVDFSVRMQNTQRLGESDHQRLRDGIAALRLFSEKASEGTALRTADVAALDRALPAILAPLAEVVAAAEGSALSPSWISAHDITITPAMALALPGGQPSPAPRRTPATFRAELAAFHLREETRAELDAIIDFLERGSAFPDLRPQVEASLHHLSHVVDLLRSLNAAAWMADEARETYMNRVHLGVVLFKDPRTRDRAQRHLDRLDASARIIDRITSLARSKVRVNAVRDAFLAADAMADDPARAELGESQLRKLDLVLGRMLEFRDLGESDLRRDLTIVERQLAQHYTEAEKRLLSEIGTLATNPDALADPAFVSLMQDQENYLGDIHRVRLLPAWVDTMRLIDPDSAGPFYQQTRKMAAWLLDTNRRPDAIRAMGQFEQQLALFYPLPFESELRSGNALAVQTTGGEHEALVRIIDATRRDWARAWADGDAGSKEANTLLLFHRLLQTMADAVHIRGPGATPAALNRWAAWELSEAALARTTTELPTRLQLAVHAAIERDFAMLEQQLGDIDRDAPVAKLLGRLTQVAGAAAMNLPGGATGTLGQLTRPPADAWWLRRRRDLATLCRYITEAEYARATKRDKLLESLTEFVNAQANAMLEDLGDRRSKIPTLIGFDGSDPNPNVEMPDRVQSPSRRR